MRVGIRWGGCLFMIFAAACGERSGDSDAALAVRDGSVATADAASPSLDAAPSGSDASGIGSPDAGEPAKADSGAPADAAEQDAEVVAGADAATGVPADASTPDAGPACVPGCGAGESCLETECVAVAFSSLCGLGGATQLIDGNAVDDAVAAALAASLSASCGSLAVATASLSDPTVFDAAAGRLLTGRSELALTSGGFYFNKLVGAMETSRRSPLYFTSDASSIGWASSATGATVHSFPDTDVTDTHDFFVVEIAPDGDGRLVLIDYGIGASGTQAAGRQAEAMLASPGTFTDTWYVYEWTLDADAGAEAIRLVGSGR